MSQCSIHDHDLKTNRYEGLFCILTYPVLYPENTGVPGSTKRFLFNCGRELSPAAPPQARSVLVAGPDRTGGWYAACATLFSEPSTTPVLFVQAERFTNA